MRGLFHPDLSGIPDLPDSASPAAAAATLAATAWIATWWFSEALPIPATSLLPVVLLPLLGVVAPKDVTRLYADHLIFLFLGGFLIALALERSGAHRRLALAVLRRAGGGPRRLVLAFMGVTAFASMWISNTAATLMMIPVALAVVHQVAAGRRAQGGEADGGLPEPRRGAGPPDAGEDEEGEGRASIPDLDAATRAFAAALVLGIAYAANLGGLGTPVGTPPNLIFQQVYGRLSGQPVSFLGWMAFGVPAVVVSVPLAWAVLVRRVPASGWRRIGAPQAAPWTAPERWVLGIFATTAMLWITRADVGDVRGWASRLGLEGRVQDSTVAIVAALLLFVVHTRGPEGRRPLLEWRDTARLPWGALLLLGGGFALSEAFQRSGLSHWLSGTLGVLRDGGEAASFTAALLAVLVLVTALTEVASNTACAAILMPVLFGLAGSLGLGTEGTRVLMLAAAMGCSNGFMAPSGTAPNAIAFATGHVPIGTFLRTGLVVDGLGVAVIAAVALVAMGG
ncbi:anion permease [Myxococcota bacterium]|nr:anion permease [Myxococcota bacterium]